MDVESLAKQLILQNMTPEQQTAVLDSIRASVTQAKDVQKQRIGENVQVVVQALKKLEADIKARYDETGKAIEKRVASIKDGKDGRNGADGKAGRDGRSGSDGATGPRGADGLNGRDGRDGDDGVSVTDAHIDFDGSLVISLSSGRVINVGEVVAPDVAEKIKIIANGGGTSQTVIDALASLQTQINNLIPSQTGNAGKFLTTNGTIVSWAEIVGGLDYQGTWNATTNTPTLASSVGVNGYYYVVATAGSTNLNGVTDWQIGDWAIYNGTAWQKIDQTNLVTSVAGRTGAITLANTDISGLGTMSTQASSSVSITGGSITGITDLAIADGGTGQSTANAAFNALAPSQTSNSGKYLKTDGTNTSWEVVPAATPTVNGLVFGSTVSSTAVNLQPFSDIVFNPITFYTNRFTLNFIEQSTWTAFINTYIGVGLPLYVAHPTVVKYYGLVTSFSSTEIFVSNPEGHGDFFSTYDGQNTTFSSPGIVGGGNVSLGYNSNNNSGAKNTVIGYASGTTITTGSNLTIVGYDSEPTSATAQNEATFGNSNTTNTRLFGSLSMGGSSAGTSGQVLTSTGSGTAPTWSTPSSGSVTSVTGTSPVVSSGGTTPAISLASGYGDTLNPYASKTANYVLAAPNGSAGVPTFRAIVAADIPTLNQNTTGNAATATNVDYSGLTGTVPTWNQNTTGTAANVTGVVAIANGGSGQITAQLAINAFAGAVTSGSYLRGNGTNVVMNTIQVADVPTLNQNTTGTSANVTGVVAIANGGTGQTTATTGFNALAPSQSANSGKYLTTDGTNSSWATVVSGATKNRIINGAMVIDQRNAGASKTTNDVYTVDRWAWYASQATKFTWGQNLNLVTPPVGFSNYFGFQSSSAYSVISSDYFQWIQQIEGFNTADLAWGTANAKTVTLSFWVYSSLTGTFAGGVMNSASNRSYPFTFSIPVANTWTQISVTIAGDTTGTWVGGTNGVGVSVRFNLGAGSNFQSTANTWGATGAFNVSGAVNVVGTNGATFYITGVQLETGSTATSFDYRPYGTELALCQRYFITYGGSASYERFGTCLCNATTGAIAMMPFPVEMRSTPTFAYSSLANLGIYTGSAVITVTAVGGDSPSPKVGMVGLTVASGLTTGATNQFLANNTTSARVTWSAEL